jgi:para-aminobenzoate synthetase component 2
VLQGLPDPFTATRYHSLTILPQTLPAELEVTARTRSGVIMGVRHTDLPIHGVQFHPESILTEGGHRMLANWLAYCGQVWDDALVRRLENEVVSSLATVRRHDDNPRSSGRALSAIDRTSA